MKGVVKKILILFYVFGLEIMHATEVLPFFLPSGSGSILEGYFSPPITSTSPIVLAIQGSCCESVFQWHLTLTDMLGSLGLGLITLEKQGISQNTINIFEYHQTNSLQKRLQDYLFVLKTSL